MQSSNARLPILDMKVLEMKKKVLEIKKKVLEMKENVLDMKGMKKKQL